MRILLTNDDGIYAPGLRALRLELQKIGTVEVVAPATEQSATGHSVTLNNPIVVQEIYDEKMARIGWAVEGRPADCVKLALRELLGYKPDLIVSGLNAGSNAGINVLYSGTVAAAIEGAFFGITSIACSLEYTKPRPMDFNTGAGLARQIVEQIINKKPAPGALFNVNIPSLENGPVLGVRVAPQNTSTYEECFDKRTDPRGRTYFWLGADFTCPNPTPETDTAALRDRFITVTPLQFNLTEHTQLEEMYSWNWTL
ncbi:MAG: 5'/3'-nucleotidase SurE [Planctomycetota bacterium]|nr:5'/3'-nucleotidase SurE [Planctomycetota bacterium]